MKKLLTSILILTSSLGVLTSCARTYTLNEFRRTEPLVEMKFPGSVAKTAYCLSELMDERMTISGGKLSEGFLPIRFAMTNHVRVGEGEASIISKSYGNNIIIAVPPVPMFLVHIVAEDNGSIGKFHREPNSTFLQSRISKKVSRIFLDCDGFRVLEE